MGTRPGSRPPNVTAWHPAPLGEVHREVGHGPAVSLRAAGYVAVTFALEAARASEVPEDPAYGGAGLPARS